MEPRIVPSEDQQTPKVTPDDTQPVDIVADTIPVKDVTDKTETTNKTVDKDVTDVTTSETSDPIALDTTKASVADNNDTSVVDNTTDSIPDPLDTISTNEPTTIPAEASNTIDSGTLRSLTPTIAAPFGRPPAATTEDSGSQKRFLLAYIVSIFSGLTLLICGSILGYALFNHFLEPKQDASSAYFFDSAPLYLSVMSTMIVFAVLYFLASQYVARVTSTDDIKKFDWRIYKVAYAIFCAILLTSAASVLASLLYLPLSSAFATEDLAGYQIGIQVLGGLHVLLWIGLLIWQERLIKRGRNVWLQGTATTVLAVLLVILAGIFLVGSKTDQRVDARTSSDLTTIASSITTYKSAHSGKLPETLSELDLKSTDRVKKRLGDYRYTVKKNGSSSTVAPQVSVGANVIGNSSDDYFSSSSSELSYDSLFNTSSNSSYELCANFRTDTTKDADDSGQISPLQLLTGASASNRDFAVHHKGQACFDL